MAEPPYRTRPVEIDMDDGYESPPPRVEAPKTAQRRFHFRVNKYFGRIGAVLDKPQWFRKWHERPEIRTRWLDEIERAYVEQTFASIFKWWPQAHDREILYRRVRSAVIALADGRPNALHEIVDAPVSYKTKWRMRWEEEEDDEDEDDEEEDDEEEDDKEEEEEDSDEYEREERELEDVTIDADEQLNETIDRTTQKLNPFGQLGWYMHQWSRIRRLREIGLDNLTLQDVDVIFGRDGQLIEDTERRYNREQVPEQDDSNLLLADQRDARDAAAVVFALRGSANLNMDTMRAALGNSEESREDVLLSLLQCVTRIHVELDAMRQFVVAYMDQVMHRCRLRPKDLEKDRNPWEMTWGPVEDTFMSDNLIPSELKDTLIQQIRVLEDVPEDQRDWHPRANGQVLDLVHPSLYCGIDGVTKCAQFHPSGYVSFEIYMEDLSDQLLSLLIRSETDGITLRPLRSQFLWLPSDFEISETGDSCQIRSYINNLHPEDHADLYRTIAAIFARFIPLFERVLGSLKGPVANVLMPPEDVLYRVRLGKLRMRQPFPTDVKVNRPSVPRFSLRGQTLQVVVKIAEIVLTPDKPRYNGGSWHIEGTEAERIIATGIYYFHNENLTDSHLAFRTDVKSPYTPQGDEIGVGVTYGLTDEQALVQMLGTVTTLENRCLVFPNVLQHQVQPFELADKTKRGVRKIMCFFVIDPSTRIPSTANIAPQQRDWIERARQQELQQSTIATNVPESVQRQILQLAHGQGLTLEVAKGYRLQLMDERSPSNTNIYWPDVFSLCEH